MSGLEVFGAIGTAISLIQMTRNKMGRAQRVGRNIDDLRLNLGDLLALQHRVEPARDADLLGRIEDLVSEATELLGDNHRTGAVASLKFFWSNSLDDDVERISRQVETIYNRLDRRLRYCIQNPGSLIMPNPH